MDEPTCCPPARTGDVRRAHALEPLIETVSRSLGGQDLLELDGGTFLMGSNETQYPADAEGPVRPVTVTSFTLAIHTVTNAAFASFVADTGYVTTAERENWSFVFSGLLPRGRPTERRVPEAPWWRCVVGARWDEPEGPPSSIEGRPNHPVVHVSWIDARAYCRWAGARLPTEAEWEYGARGGLEQRCFPWGDELTPGGLHRMNVFQGKFPGDDTGEDGWIGTAPVGSYPPNGFGLCDMTGNVWEWTSDLFGPSRPGQRALRGGSFLCHESYCRRYRCAARIANTPDSTTSNVGFRVVADR